MGKRKRKAKQIERINKDIPLIYDTSIKLFGQDWSIVPFVAGLGGIEHIPFKKGNAVELLEDIKKFGDDRLSDNDEKYVDIADYVFPEWSRVEHPGTVLYKLKRDKLTLGDLNASYLYKLMTELDKFDNGELRFECNKYEYEDTRRIARVIISAALNDESYKYSVRNFCMGSDNMREIIDESLLEPGTYSDRLEKYIEACSYKGGGFLELLKKGMSSLDDEDIAMTKASASKEILVNITGIDKAIDCGLENIKNVGDCIESLCKAGHLRCDALRLLQYCYGRSSAEGPDTMDNLLQLFGFNNIEMVLEAKNRAERQVENKEASLSKLKIERKNDRKRINNLKNELHSKKVEVRNLEVEVEKLKIKGDTKNLINKLKEENDKQSKEIEILKSVIENRENKIDELKNNLRDLESVERNQSDTELVEETDKVEEIDIEEIKDIIRNKKIAVCGSSKVVRNKMNADGMVNVKHFEFEYTQYGEDIAGCDAVLCLTDYIKHCAYDRAKGVCKKNKIPFVHSSGTNVNNMYKIIYDTLDSESKEIENYV